MGSIVEDDLVEANDYEERLKRCTCKGLFLNLQLVCRLMEKRSRYLYDYK